ncbi:glycosyltransferase family 4 protein [Flavobacterium piscis]|uniref:Glycosyltransferase involved in cell wall biosynthesis n=1 Tax=Flavobacterium piscis TaxID=1114874 RepID=A0ABU1Y412_9FLAO|nr:glycosyltransferase family 4 protein [Flavobacterium piscis]MDR7208962.1 glycosyltransferase involved in cell wall biosynthesis [Flavobacterium piscis]
MKILFISHDASRTGAPILLLNLAKLILNFNEHEVTFLLKNGGVLETDFSSIAPTYFLKNKQKRSRLSFLFRIKKSIIENHLFLNSFDLIISNTITNGDILEIIKKTYQGKIISYIHELEIASKTFSNEQNILKLIQNSTRFWVPSSIVNNYLKDKLKIDQHNIFTMPYHIPNYSSEIKLKKIKKEFIVGGCGTTDWRKGADLLIVIAKQLFLKYPDVSIVFRWAGANSGIQLDKLNYEIGKSELTNKVFFEFSSSDLNDFYNSIDLLLLPSREDPYPLVILEAAKFNIPSICFDSVCGSKDFILDSSGGIIVPFLDIEGVIQAIINLYNDTEYRNKLGENANFYLNSTHSNDEFVYDIFKELIEK